jgi:polyvinyl alcohol dehydrogenase (cytochrome)
MRDLVGRLLYEGGDTAMPRLFDPCLTWAVWAGILLGLGRTVGAENSQGLPQAPGAAIYGQSCATCHANPAGARVPDLKALMALTPEAIYTQMTAGVMVVQAQKLTDEEKRAVAEYLGGRPLDLNRSGSVQTMPNRCASISPMGDPGAGAAWNGWSPEASNTRFAARQTAGLTPEQVPHLKLKWAFGFPGGGGTAYGQPTVVAGRIFVGGDNGYLYSIDAASGCVYWSFQAKAGVRTAPVIGPVKRQGTTQYAVYIGDMRANVYALDVQTGKQLWIARADEHITARISGAPSLYQGRLYVPISSSEEVVAPLPSYGCCTFRGSVVAYDAETGRQIWKSYTIAGELKPTRKNASGAQLWGPAGGAVWNSPTIDPQRGVLYIGTGDAYTEPAAPTTDAAEAMDLRTGKIVWSYQTLANDVWILGCPSPTPNENCPKKTGPDHDVGASPILAKLANGRSMVIVTPKSGTVFALDPDRHGAVIWKLSLTDKTAATNGLIALGGAADSHNLYLGLEDGTFVAIDLAKGRRVWTVRLQSLDLLGPPNALGEPRTKTGLRFGQSAAATGIPGVVFTGGWDGIFRALSTRDGRVLWNFNTARDFKTGNGVEARGGSMGGPGATVVNGMVYVPSGYVMFGGALPGNVLLAFAAE